MTKKYFLGADVGSTKTEVMIADEAGNIAGTGLTGAGNHETVGYPGLVKALSKASLAACREAGISLSDIAGSGFGVSGYDWDCELAPTLEAVREAGFTGPVKVVNDTMIGLIAGASEGWGVAVVAGTGCNCWGRNRTHDKVGRVTGCSRHAGEAAGSYELAEEMMCTITREWTLAGPRTALTRAVMEATQEYDLYRLLERYYNGEGFIDASFAPLVFRVAASGDSEALRIVNWAALSLADLAKAVIRQLDFMDEAFEVVLLGSMFKAGDILIGPMQRSILESAPKARFVYLQDRPAVGAVILGMEAGGWECTSAVRERLSLKP